MTPAPAPRPALRWRAWLRQVDRFWWEFILTLAGYNLLIGGILYLLFKL